MQKSFSGFLKAGKIKKTKQTSYLVRVTKYWRVKYWDKFAKFYNYFCYNKTYNIVIGLLVLTIFISAKLFTEG